MLPKKQIVGIIAIIVIIGTILSRGITIAYWQSINWNLISIHPLIPVLSIISSSCYLITLYLTVKGNLILWFLGVTWLGISIIMAWAKFCVI